MPPIVTSDGRHVAVPLNVRHVGGQLAQPVTAMINAHDGPTLLAVGGLTKLEYAVVHLAGRLVHDGFDREALADRIPNLVQFAQKLLDACAKEERRQSEMRQGCQTNPSPPRPAPKT